MIAKISVTVFMLFIILFPSSSQENQKAGKQKISTIGIYEGYSIEKYDSFYRESQYVKMSDGIQIAVDIYLPQKNGITENHPLPVIWNHTR